MSNEEITNIDYWANRHETMQAHHIQGHWIYDRYLAAIMPHGDNLSCLEVGVYPGNNLLYLAQKYHYYPVGMDFSPYVAQLKDAFLEHNIEGEFIQADFLRWQADKQFDLVISHGFIEHFENYQDVIDRHWQLVKPGGIMVITVPLYTPYQRLARSLIFTPEMWDYMLTSHNLNAMNLNHLKDIIGAYPDSEILKSGYANGIKVWYHAQSKGVRPLTKAFFPFQRFLERVFNKLNINNRLVSPEAYIATKKIE